MTREIALDTETTGLSPKYGHRIIEIGCVEMKDRIRTGESFQVFINPERDVPEEAYRVHGISSEFLADKPLFDAVADSFLEFIEDSPLVIHNASFDMMFLKSELERLGKDKLLEREVIDTLDIARKKFPGAKANLDALCKRYNIDITSRVLHGALLDAELLADVYLELCGGAQDSMFSDDEMKGNVQKKQVVSKVSHENREKRFFPASDEENEKHRQFIKELTDPLWEG